MLTHLAQVLPPAAKSFTLGEGEAAYLIFLSVGDLHALLGVPQQRHQACS